MILFQDMHQVPLIVLSCESFYQLQDLRMKFGGDHFLHRIFQ